MRVLVALQDFSDVDIGITLTTNQELYMHSEY